MAAQKPQHPQGSEVVSGTKMVIEWGKSVKICENHDIPLPIGSMVLVYIQKWGYIDGKCYHI
jgi:hypothetical protein